MKIYRDYLELKYLAYYDPLTGLLNRNWLYKNIDKIKAKYVYFIDINDLLEVNKNGHTCGDDYIKMVVSLITCSGIFIRYAGDEFLLFSDDENVIKTNRFFAVGCSLITTSIEESIREADARMIENKRLYKIQWW